MTNQMVTTCEDGRQRCAWCVGDALYQRYHDQEWGYPVLSDSELFERFTLEAFQAGLSWLTVLRKREHFREAFANFDLEVVASFGQSQITQLLQDRRIIRHRGKIEATIHNAQQALLLTGEAGSLAEFFWQFEPPASVPQQPLPAETEGSRQLSRELKRRDWKFVGPTTCYAFMQAVGLVNDHLPDCFVRDKVDQLRRK